MNRLARTLLGPVHRRYRALVDRVWNLEMAVDCLIANPVWVDSEDVGFNGQRLRKSLFRDLQAACAFEGIIETGTWMGDTTGYLANATGVPVYTCEINRRFHALSRRRLAAMPAIGSITFRLGDSRAFLKELAATPLAQRNVFIYLDAHWYDDLPLLEEIEVICAGWQRFVVMIDDLQVPGDDGYAYDNYGVPLNLAMIARSVERNGLAAFFPSAPSSREVVAATGCVVLARKGATADTLAGLPSLRAAGR